MSLVTFKNYSKTPDDASVPRKAISLLLEALSVHAVQFDKAEYETYRLNLEPIQVIVKEDASGERLLLATGRATEVFAAYCQNITGLVRQQSLVLHNMIAMLAETVISIGAGSEESVQRLQNIEAQLNRAVMIDDLRQAKEILNECLQDVRSAAAQQKSQMEQLASKMQEQVGRARELNSNVSVDAVTGLPGQTAALATIDETLQLGGHYFVVVVVFSRLQSINMRFGNDVGDNVFRTIAGRFRSELPEQDRVFRWRGPAVIALLKREETLFAVRGEIRKIRDGLVEDMFEVGERRVMISLGSVSVVVPLSDSRAQTVKAIDDFINIQTNDNKS